eukprot:PhF_6_TR6884/c1_g2_i1/m.9922
MNVEDMVTYINEDIAAPFLLMLTRGEYAIPKQLSINTNGQRIKQNMIAITNVRFRVYNVKTGCPREAWVEGYDTCYANPRGLSDYNLSATVRSLPLLSLYDTSYRVSFTVLDESLRFPSKIGAYYPFGGQMFEYDPFIAIGTIANFSNISTSYIGESTPVAEDVFLQGSREGFYPFKDLLGLNTRAVAVEFVLASLSRYSPVLGYTLMMFEFPAEGGCVPTFYFTPMPTSNGGISLEISLAVYASLYLFGMWAAAVFKALRYGAHRDCVSCLVSQHYHTLRYTEWYPCRKCTKKYDRTHHEICPHCDAPKQSWVHTCFLRGTFLRPRHIIVAVNVFLIGFRISAAQTTFEKVRAHVDAFQGWQERSGVKPTSFPPFGPFYSMQTDMRVVSTIASVHILAAMCWFFTYLDHIAIFHVFGRMFATGVVQLIAFILYFGVAIIGFSFAFHVIGATNTAGLSTISDSVKTVLRILTFEYGYDDFVAEDDLYGSILYFTFCVLAAFIGLNVFISIVLSSYDSARTAVTDDRVDASLMLLWKKVKAFLRMVPTTTTTSAKPASQNGTAPNDDHDDDNIPLSPISPIIAEADETLIRLITKVVLEEIRKQPSVTSIGHRDRDSVVFVCTENSTESREAL